MPIRRPGEFLVTYALNHPTAVCMSEKGHHWDPPGLYQQSPDLVEAFGRS